MPQILTLPERARLATDDFIQEVTRTAHNYRTQHPDIPWAEALRLAEKHVPYPRLCP